MRTDNAQHPSTLRDYLNVLRRRKWIALQAVILVPACAVVLSVRQQHLYQGTAEVLLSHQNLSLTLTNNQDPTLYQQADRIAETEAELARVPAVARRVLQETKLRDRRPQDILDASSVSPKQNADLLEFRVNDPDQRLAVRLARTYARQFTYYRRQLDTAKLERALRELNARMARLRAARATHSPLYATLVDKEQQLRTMEALQTTPIAVRSSDHATKVQPKPLRNGILGFLFGLLLGIGLAFLWEALDTRVRSTKEIGERLGLPLLGRLPEPSRRLRSAGRLVMVEEPNAPEAEAFRMLRANLEFANLERDAKTIVVTSAVESEGKSTTAANLAVSCALSGKRVVLVDLDLRRPSLDRFFDLQDRPGLTNVALGQVTLDEAITLLAVGGAKEERDASANGNGHGNGTAKRNGKRAPKEQGLLEVLPAGPIPPNTGEFVGTQALGKILAELRKRADLVLIDAPPMLHVGDAMTLSARVDALLVVTRLKVVKRPMLAELERMLTSSPAHALGFVAAGVESDDEYRSSYRGYYYRSQAPAQVALPDEEPVQEEAAPTEPEHEAPTQQEPVQNEPEPVS